MKLLVLSVSIIFICGLAGCFEWRQDASGNLQSVGVPGAPIWQSKNPPAQSNPHESTVTPEEARRMRSGPVLVIPSADGNYIHRSYEPGQNRCDEDLKKMLEDRARTAGTGPAPYCAAMQVGEVKSRGGQGVIW